jgi:hypothetical protein
MAHISKTQQANKAFNIFNTEDVKPTNEPKNNIWLNIGITTMVENEDGIEEEQFINLPINISLDMIQNSANYKYLMSGKSLSPLSIKKRNLIKAIEKQVELLDNDNPTYNSKLNVQFYKELPKEVQIIENEDEFIDLI